MGFDRRHADPETAAFWAAAEEEKAWRWLANNVRRARFIILSDAELLGELGGLPSHDDPVFLRTAVMERLKRGSREYQEATAAVLANFIEAYPGPGRDAVSVDRAVQRLLPQLPDPMARPLAIVCLQASRRDRKSAAWRYYRKHGLDDASRDILAGESERERRDEYRKLVAGDVGMVVRLGADAVLEIAPPNRYWRSKVIEAVLATGADAQEYQRRHPGAWLWAVARRGDAKLLPVVLDLLEDNAGNVDLVNRVLLCLLEFGDRAAIDEALTAAFRLLDSHDT